MCDISIAVCLRILENLSLINTFSAFEILQRRLKWMLKTNLKRIKNLKLNETVSKSEDAFFKPLYSLELTNIIPYVITFLL